MKIWLLRMGRGRVALNDPCAYAAERLNAKRQRGHVQKEKPLDASGEHAPLQTRAHRDALVGVDALKGVVPVIWLTSSCTAGMRLEPPTMRTLLICEIMPESLMA